MSYAGQMSHRNRGRGLFAADGLGVAATTTKTGSATTPATPDRTAADWTAGISAVGPLVGSLFGAATGTSATTPAATEEIVDPAAATAPASASPSWYWPVVIGVGVAVLGGIGYMSYNVKAPVKANRRKRRLRRNNWRRSLPSFWVWEDRGRYVASKTMPDGVYSMSSIQARNADEAIALVSEREGLRRALRRNYAYQHTSHPGSYDSHGRPRRNSRRRNSRRS